MFWRDAHELGEKIVAQVLKLVPNLTRDIGDEAIPNFLFNWRSCEAQNPWSTGRLLILVEEKVRHDQVVVMTLVCVVALVKYYHIELLYLDETMHQSVVKFFLGENEHIKAGKLVLPVFVLEFSRHHFLRFLVVA